MIFKNLRQNIFGESKKDIQIEIRDQLKEILGNSINDSVNSIEETAQKKLSSVFKISTDVVEGETAARVLNSTAIANETNAIHLLSAAKLEEMGVDTSQLTLMEGVRVSRNGNLITTRELTEAEYEQLAVSLQQAGANEAQIASMLGLVEIKKMMTIADYQRMAAEIGLTEAQAGQIIQALGLSVADGINLTTSKALTKQEVLEALAHAGVTDATTKETFAKKLLNAQNLKNVGSSGLLTKTLTLLKSPLTWVVVALGAATVAFAHFHDTAEETVEKVDNLKKSFDSALKTANDNLKTFEGFASRYEELADGVDAFGRNISLSNDEFEEYNNIVNQLADMSPELVKGYTSEGNAILFLKGNVDKLKQSYIDAQKEAYNLLISSGKDGDGNDIVKQWNDLKNTDFFAKAFDLGASDVGGDISTVDAIKQLEAIQNMSAETYRNIENTIASGSRTAIASLSDIEKEIGYGSYIYKALGIDRNVTDEEFATAKKQAKALIQTYNAEVEAALSDVEALANAYLMVNEDYDKLDEQSKSVASMIVNSLNADIANGFSSNEDIDGYVDKIVQTILSDDKVAEALKDLFTMDTSNMSISEIESQVDYYIGIIANALKEDPVELKTRLGFDDSETKHLVNKVKGFLNNEFDDKVSGLTLEELDIASNLEISEGTLLSWDELITKIKEVQSSTSDNKIKPISLQDAKIKIIGGGEDGVTGLIDELQLLQEVLADTDNISQETYEKLLSCSKDYATAIRTENGRITLNTTKLKQVAKQRNLDTKATIKETLAIKKQEWLQWKNKIENYNGTLLDSIETKYDDIDALQAEITQYELLVNSLDNATSAFERFKNAQSTEDQDMYNTAQEAFNVLKGYSSDPSNENYGKYNSDEFQEAAMLLMDTDTYTKALNAKDLTEYQKVVKGFVKSISPLFDENNAKSASKLFDEVDKIVASGDTPVADQDWADRLGISKEAFNALKQLANLYDYNNKEVFESFPLDKLDDYQEKVSNVATEYETLNSIEDKTSNEYLKQEQAYKQAKEKRDAFINETTTDMTNAFTNYQKSGGMDGRTFADYVKDQFDFEDTDVTGSMFALIDKADALKQKLNTISSNEDVQKQFAEYDQLQMIMSVLSALGYEYEKTANNKEKYTQALEESTDYGTSHKNALEEEFKSFEELKKQEEQFKRQMSSSVFGSEMYTDAQNGLTQVQSQLEELRGSLKLKLELDISDVETKIGETEKAKQKFQQENSGLEDTIYYRGRTAGYDTELEQLNSQKDTLEQKLKIVIEGDEEAQSAIDSLSSATIEDKTFSVSANDLATTVIDKVNAQKIADKTFNITANLKVPKLDLGLGGSDSSEDTGGGGAYGTVNIGHGHAYADGNIGTDKPLKNVMVGEIAPEMVIDPHSGEYTIYNNPTMLDKLPKDAIVFNGKQTEEILKNGMTTSFGKAYANGNVSGNAFNDGRGTKVNVINFNDVKTNNNAIKDAKKDSSNKEEEVKEEKELTEEFFDWIERRVKKLQRFFDRWFNNAEAMLKESQMVGGLLAKYYKKASGNLNKQMDVQSQAYSRYMQEADNSGLSDDYKKKVRDGLIDIETITDDELKEKISKYQENFDKATDALTAFEEAAKQRFNIPLDKATKKVDVFGKSIELFEKKVDNAIGATAKNKLIKEQDKEEKKTLNAYKVAEKESAKNLKSQSKKMTSSSILKGSDISAKEKKNINKAVKAGKEVDISYFKEGSKAYKQAVKYNEALRANTQATYDAEVAQEEYNSWLVESAKLKFDNVADEYENKIKQYQNDFTDIDNKIAEIEASGKRISKLFYDKQKALNEQELAQYKAEKVELEKKLKGIKVGTEEWYDAKDAIQEVENAISKCTQETAKLNNAITDLHYSRVDDIANMINGINEEQDFLQGLFSHEKLTDDDTGNFTEAGIAKLGSTSTQYYASKEKAENAKKEVDVLKHMKDNNLLSYSDGNTSLVFNSPEELDRQYKERYKVLQDEISEAYNKEKELFDLMEQKYQAELSYVKQLVDDQKEALQREKDLHDYQRQIAEKTKSINTIQSQLAAYKGDSSQEGMAKLQKLNKELADAQDGLKETEYDRYISDQQNMLDKLVEEYEESITNQLENFKNTVSGALGIANNNTSQANTYLAAIAKANGYEIKDDVNLKNIEKVIENKTTDINKDKTTNNPTNNPNNNNGNNYGDEPNNQPKEKTIGEPPEPTSTMPTIPADNTFPSIRPDQIKNEWETKRKEVEAIFGNEKYYAKGKKKSADGYKTKINKYLFNKNKKALTTAGLKELRKVLGTNNAGLYDAMIELKKHISGHIKHVGGFRTGGIAELVRARGEDGIAMVRNGEGFIAPEHVPAIQELLETVPLVNNMLQPLVEAPKLPNITPVNNAANNILQIDTLTLPNVTNYEEFRDSMYKDMQSNKKFEGMIRDMSINQVSGGGRLSKYNKRF